MMFSLHWRSVIEESERIKWKLLKITTLNMGNSFITTYKFLIVNNHVLKKNSVGVHKLPRRPQINISIFFCLFFSLSSSSFSVLHHLPANRTSMAVPLLKISFISVRHHRSSLHNLAVDFMKWMKKTFPICSKSINIIHLFINWVANNYFNMVWA